MKSIALYPTSERTPKHEFPLGHDSIQKQSGEAD